MDGRYSRCAEWAPTPRAQVVVGGIRGRPEVWVDRCRRVTAGPWGDDSAPQAGSSALTGVSRATAPDATTRASSRAVKTLLMDPSS